MDLRAVFPDRVRGSPLTAADSLKVARGPISSLIMLMSSREISDSFFWDPARRQGSVWVTVQKFSYFKGTCLLSLGIQH